MQSDYGEKLGTAEREEERNKQRKKGSRQLRPNGGWGRVMRGGSLASIINWKIQNEKKERKKEMALEVSSSHEETFGYPQLCEGRRWTMSRLLSVS